VLNKNLEMKRIFDELEKLLNDGQKTNVKNSYSEIKEGKKEKVIFVKLKVQQKSKATKKIIKEETYEYISHKD